MERNCGFDKNGTPNEKNVFIRTLVRYNIQTFTFLTIFTTSTNSIQL